MCCVSDVNRDPVPDIDRQTLLDTVKEECPLPSYLSQVVGGHQPGIDKMVPNIHIESQLFSGKYGPCASNHGPINHLITKLMADLIQVNNSVQLGYLIGAMRCNLNFQEGINWPWIISNLPLSDCRD